PVVLGLILGGFAEVNLRISLMIGQGSWSILWANNLSKFLIALTLFVVLMPLIKAAWAKRGRKAKPEG
ncbi:MAG: C4-dicarboxylate ABC transporter permease, partial [Marinosulfonomonas sp.]|nr:C4-dicarboxylate ABC transporter permease [Marinosulfonomonas sp.]